MKIRIYSLLFCGFALGPLSAFAQQSPLLEKYRTMALDYNHDLKAAEKNIAASVGSGKISPGRFETETFRSS